MSLGSLLALRDEEESEKEIVVAHAVLFREDMHLLVNWGGLEVSTYADLNLRGNFDLRGHFGS